MAIKIKGFLNYLLLQIVIKSYSFLELNAFLSTKVSDGYLGLNHYENVDFDVFLTRPAYFWYDFVETDRKCFHHQVFSYTHNLFAALFSY